MGENNLDKILREYIIGLGDSNMNRYARYYQFAVNYLREFSQTFNGIPKQVELDISCTDTVMLPNDYSEYRIIGVCGADGKLHSLGRNENICLGNNCNRREQNQSFQVGIPSQAIGFGSMDGLSQSWKNGEFVGKMYGINGGNSAFGEFRIDLSSGTIKFAKVRTNICSVVMEYTPKLTPIDGDFEVPQYFIQTLKYWIFFQDIVFNKNVSQAQIAEAERRYFAEDRWSRRKLQAVSIQDWYKAFRSVNTASIKF